MSRGSKSKKPANSKLSLKNKPSPVSPNGKGDSPRNVSIKFKENYDKIDWSSKPKKGDKD